MEALWDKVEVELPIRVRLLFKASGDKNGLDTLCFRMETFALLQDLTGRHRKVATFGYEKLRKNHERKKLGK